MCIACSPGFQAAFRSLSWPSRRRFLKGVAAASAGAAFIAEAVEQARADGVVNATVAKGLQGVLFHNMPRWGACVAYVPDSTAHIASCIGAWFSSFASCADVRAAYESKLRATYNGSLPAAYRPPDCRVINGLIPAASRSTAAKAGPNAAIAPGEWLGLAAMSAASEKS